MRTLALTFLLLALIAVPVFGQDAQTNKDSAGYSMAVIVAVEFYSSGWAWRPDAYKDANNIAWILSNHSFEVHRLYGSNATAKNILKALDKASEKAGDEGSVLVYFTGHGLHPESDPSGDYVVPYGARVGEDADLIKVSTLKNRVLDTIRPENALFIFDTGSTLDQPNQEFGTILELATSLKEALSGHADKNNNGRVEFSELAKQIGPKVKDVKIHARPADEVFLSEDEVVVISTKINKKKKRKKRERDRFRPDQFDRLLEMRMEEKMRKMDELDQKMQEMDKLMEDPMRRLPFPRAQ